MTKKKVMNNDNGNFLFFILLFLFFLYFKLKFVERLGFFLERKELGFWIFF